jgi:Carboxypeptidase regulatory-like domain
MKDHSAALLLAAMAAKLLVFAAVGLTQSPAQAPPSGAVLGGLVTKEPGSEPLKKALIELIAESQNEGGNHTALTGTDGGFRIENITPGRYRLFVERTGFQEVDRHHKKSDGRLLTLAAGQEIKDLVIHLRAAAVIQGRVTDEDGDPMPEAQVAVFRQTFVMGHSDWEQIGAERTNDLGEYRIANLAAGSYFASVTPPPDFRSLIETAFNAPRVDGPNNASEKAAPTAYQTIYYPDARGRAQAAPIQLHAGDEFPANFSLAPSPSLTIRGSVANIPAGSAVSIMLQSRDFNLVLNGAEMHKDGSFEIRDVSPGAYTIVATVDQTSAPMMARQMLQVAESVDGLRLAPQIGGSIRGRIRVEANAVVRPAVGEMFLLLRPGDDSDDVLGSMGLVSMPAQVNADGSFEWKNVMPGRYFVQISDGGSFPDWFFESVSAGGRDVTESGFMVGGVTALDVVASAHGASVEGAATDAKDEPTPDATIVAVPETRYRHLPDHYRKAVSDQSGHFRLRGLPPGSYTLYAWESVDGEAYTNAEFLRSYEGQGKALRVGEGDHATAQLKVIPAGDDGQ